MRSKLNTPFFNFNLFLIFVVIFRIKNFIQMKKSVRKITINEQKWTWVVESLNYCTIKEVRIYSPEKKMFRLKPEDISTMKTYAEYAGDTYYIILPHMVREYIDKNLINS